MKQPLLGLLAVTAMSLGETSLFSQECACQPRFQPFVPAMPPAPLCPAPLPPMPVCPTPRIETRTEWVPQVVMQRQKVVTQEVQMQTRDKLVTVYDQVLQPVNVPIQETTVGYETRYQPQTSTYLQPVTREISQPVAVPRTVMETREVERKVVRNERIRVRKEVTMQEVTRTFYPGRAEAVQTAGEPVKRIVEEEVIRPRECIEKCVMQVPVVRNETQQVKQQVVEYQPVQQTVNMPYTVAVPRTQVRQQVSWQYRSVPRQVVQQELVAVPVAVEREIDVPVTQYVPRTVQIEVPY